MFRLLPLRLPYGEKDLPLHVSDMIPISMVMSMVSKLRLLALLTSILLFFVVMLFLRSDAVLSYFSKKPNFAYTMSGAEEQWRPNLYTAPFNEYGIWHRQQGEGRRRSSGEQHTTRDSPIFVHITKTGGTSIETAFAAAGVKVGRNYFLSPKGTKERLLKQSDPRANLSDTGYNIGKLRCSKTPWHQPPLDDFVPHSFTVVRNPYQRLISEFCFEAKKHKSNCDDFRVWAYDRLGKVLAWMEKTMGGVRVTGSYPYHCHLLPQMLYVPKVEWIFEYRNFTRNVEVLAAQRYGLLIAMRHIHENLRPYCNARVNMTCYGSELAKLVQEWETGSFENLGYNRNFRLVG